MHLFVSLVGCRGCRCSRQLLVSYDLSFSFLDHMCAYDNDINNRFCYNGCCHCTASVQNGCTLDVVVVVVRFTCCVRVAASMYITKAHSVFFALVFSACNLSIFDKKRFNGGKMHDISIFELEFLLAVTRVKS